VNGQNGKLISIGHLLKEGAGLCLQFEDSVFEKYDLPGLIGR